MRECEKRYNEDVKNPANFDFDKRSYMAGCQAALEWARDNAGDESSDSRAVYGDIVKELSGE